MVDNELQRSFYFAQKHGNLQPHLFEDWKRILERGHDPNEDWTRQGITEGTKRSSPLFHAILEGETRLAELLLEHGADPERYNSHGHTALQGAVAQSDGSIVKLLLERGASSSSPIRSEFLCGGTALHLAAVEGSAGIVDELISRGADALARTAVGWTAADLAILDRQDRLLPAILGRIDLKDTVRGYYVDVDEAALDESPDTAAYLIEHGAHGTESKHVSLYYHCLSEILSSPEHHVENGASFCESMSSSMETALLKKANMRGDTSWPRNLCVSCKLLESRDSGQALQIFQHCDDWEALLSSAELGCNLCQYFVEVLDHHWCLLHQIDRKYMQQWGVSRAVRISVERPARRPVPWKGDHRLIVACGDRISFTDLNHVQSTPT